MSYTEALELFYQIRGIYQSPYFDSQQEIDEAVFTLIEAINCGEVNKEYLLAKAKIVALRANEEYKQKTSNIIKSKFWL